MSPNFSKLSKISFMVICFWILIFMLLAFYNNTFDISKMNIESKQLAIGAFAVLFICGFLTIEINDGSDR